MWLSALMLFFLPTHDCVDIIGGSEVKPHSLPYMAYLENGKVSCAGAVLNRMWLVTAAHCMRMKTVFLGVHDYSRDDRSTWQVRKVQKEVPHPCYNQKEKVYDIMLIKMNKPVKEMKNVSFLFLPDAEKILHEGVKCTVAGWGAIKNGGRPSNTLRSVTLTVISNRVCNSHKFYNGNPVITRNMVCAGYVDNKPADSCQGDSGAPLICEAAFRGVASFGKQCGIKTKPGVYTALSQSVLQWMRKTLYPPR